MDLTAESFGGDPEKRKACLYYVHQSVAVSGFYCVTAGLIARSWWPIIGYVIAASYMYWLYTRALSKAGKSGSKGWSDSGSQNGSGPDTSSQGAPSKSYPWS